MILQCNVNYTINKKVRRKYAYKHFHHDYMNRHPVITTAIYDADEELIHIAFRFKATVLLLYVLLPVVRFKMHVDVIHVLIFISVSRIWINRVIYELK